MLTREESNLRPRPYQGRALTAELRVNAQRPRRCLWERRDSNPRSHMATGLQPAPFVRSGTRPWAGRSAGASAGANNSRARSISVKGQVLAHRTAIVARSLRCCTVRHVRAAGLAHARRRVILRSLFLTAILTVMVLAGTNACSGPAGTPQPETEGPNYQQPRQEHMTGSPESGSSSAVPEPSGSRSKNDDPDGSECTDRIARWRAANDIAWDYPGELDADSAPLLSVRRAWREVVSGCPESRRKPLDDIANLGNDWRAGD